MLSIMLSKVNKEHNISDMTRKIVKNETLGIMTKKQIGQVVMVCQT